MTMVTKDGALKLRKEKKKNKNVTWLPVGKKREKSKKDKRTHIVQFSQQYLTNPFFLAKIKHELLWRVNKPKEIWSLW